MDAHPPASQERAVQRDPAIDLVRFTCLLLVVAAHCMMVSPVLHKDGTVTTLNVLMEQRWFTPVAWGLMIVPLFFVLGGVTGLQSWRRLKAHGGNGFDFAQLRLLRLVRPAMAVLAVMWGRAMGRAAAWCPPASHPVDDCRGRDAPCGSWRPTSRPNSAFRSWPAFTNACLC